ncbi:MAG: TetR/AcrR family transcriptional regulator [Actinomyces succiniciruminis]|nr:TetR/AcrR family transcriptional regulator [Actinomyces succiniciruminis]
MSSTPAQPHAASPETTSTTSGGRWRGPGRPPAGSEDKRERILNEAVALFGAHGYAGTSLADIAAAAEISKAGLLHHFSSKEALFAQVLERRDREDRASLLGDEQFKDDPWRLLDAFAALVEHNTRHRELVAIYTATTPAVLAADHPAHTWLASHLAESIAQIEDTLERGKAAGTVRPEAPSRLIARSVVALSDGLQIQWLCATTPGTAAEVNVGTGMVDEMRLYVDDLKRRWRIG